MAKHKQSTNEREYIIPLRREIRKVPKHKRAPKAVKAIKQFLARHMRVPERDVSKIRLDEFINKELWHRGIKKPPTKIKLKVKRDGELIRAELVDLTEKFKFELLKKEGKKKTAEEAEKKVEEKKPEEKEEKKVEEKTEEEKKEEKEKKEASKEAKEKIAEAQAKQQKHLKKSVSPKSQHRKALQK